MKFIFGNKKVKIIKISVKIFGVKFRVSFFSKKLFTVFLWKYDFRVERKTIWIWSKYLWIKNR